MAMFVKSEYKSLSVRVIQRIVSFEKGTLNILLEEDENLQSPMRPIMLVLVSLLSLLIEPQMMETSKNLLKQL